MRSMLTGPVADNIVEAVARRPAGPGAGPDALRAAILPRLRKAVPVDALWWAWRTRPRCFTRSYQEELPEDSGRVLRRERVPAPSQQMDRPGPRSSGRARI